MVYLDFNASTPLDLDAQSEQIRALKLFANPSNQIHMSGGMASQALESARTDIAKSLGIASQEVIFTSGATESAWIAIVGLALKLPPGKSAIGVITTEHKAVIEACRLASELGGNEIVQITVDALGQINARSLDVAISGGIGLLVAMAVNNETGVVTDVSSLQEICRTNGVFLVSDLTQAIGKIPVLDFTSQLDCGFFSGHKIYGPRGIGVLFMKRSLQKQVKKLLSGGGQERGFRGGTENLPSVMALNIALQKAIQCQEIDSIKSQELTRLFESELSLKGIRFCRTAGEANVVPNTLSLRFVDCDADAILANAPEVEASTGSACEYANPEPSHVLLAMGFSRTEASEVIRFSFGRSTSRHEVSVACGAVADAIELLRGR
jgi:cysteine desulfurase